MIFRHPALMLLEDQLTRFTPVGRKTQQQGRAEKFLHEIDASKNILTSLSVSGLPDIDRILFLIYG